ncbi:MAG: hypothetical protein HYZ12_04340 [Thaumarchaeota archaeon]|nr:hypothetical protein [Nitrososphaerota archaeon]
MIVAVFDHEPNAVGVRFKRPMRNGVTTALFALAVYLAVLVITTPNLPPLSAVMVGSVLNWWVILGITVGSGVQVFLISYSKELGCNIRSRPAAGSAGFFSAFSSFISYFALIPVGCCGTWLYIISFLPGIIGTSGSAFLIGDSKTLTLFGMVIMLASILYTYFSIRSTSHRKRSRE